MSYSKYWLASFVFLLFAINSIAVQAQRTIGVDWQVPEDSQLAVEQLHTFNNLGISIIKLTPPVPSEVWTTIEDLGLTVYGDLNIKYPTAQVFADPDSLLLDNLKERSSKLLNNVSVQAIGFFSYGSIQNNQFRTTIIPFVTELNDAGSHAIYATLSPSQTVPNDTLAVDFLIEDVSITSDNISDLSVPNHPKIDAYQYRPSASLKKYLTPFKQFIDITGEYSQRTVFINGQWLLSSIEIHSSFSTTIQSLTSKEDPIFLMPNESLPSSQQSAIPILLLLIIWISAGIHYNTSPLYRKSLFRYFNAHKFFIDDIFQRHIRSASPALILIFQNTVLMGAALFAFVQASINSFGLNALFYHLSFLSLFGSGAGSLAIWTALFSVAISFLSIFWLYISHKRISSLTQIATIYAWPLQLNLLFVTALIALFASGGPLWLISTIALVTVLVQLFVPSHTLLYLFVTSGLYLIIIAGLFIWGMVTPSLKSVLALTISL